MHAHNYMTIIFLYLFDSVLHLCQHVHSSVPNTRVDVSLLVPDTRFPVFVP